MSFLSRDAVTWQSEVSAPETAAKVHVELKAGFG